MEAKKMEGAEFYPTPEDIAQKMADKLAEEYVHDKESEAPVFEVLEPEAGKGDLIDAIAKKTEGKVSIDFIEKDDNLRTICETKFNGLFARHYGDEEYLNAKVRCVGTDFLQFETHKRYDFIVMTPPFSEGAEHLLKAISVQERHGGKIIALLDAETIRNPHSLMRKTLAEKLKEYDAEIEYLKDAFATERRTDVEVALITMTVPAAKKESDILASLKLEMAEKKKEEEKMGHIIDPSETYVDKLIEQYDFEIRIYEKLIDEYASLSAHMLHNRLMYVFSDVSINDCIEAVRLRYWEKYIYSFKITGRLSLWVGFYLFNFDELLKGCDFNRFNILQIKNKVIKPLNKAFGNNILRIFDKLSNVNRSTGQPEGKNVHYYNGWKTNLAWKINEKDVIFPWDSKRWDEGVHAIYFDINKALRGIEEVLDSLDMVERHAQPPLDCHSLRVEITKRKKHFKTSDVVEDIPLKYFKFTLHKNGTCHIKWTCGKRLLDSLNIVSSQLRGWLPPGYGKKHYKDMSEEERSVIDSFQGEEEYEKALSDPDYFFPEMNLVPSLTGEIR